MRPWELWRIRSKLRAAQRHARRVGLYRSRTILKTLIYRHVHGHVVGDPFETIPIDPNDVEYYLSPRFGPESYVFDIKGGDWDRTRPKPIAEYDMYQAFERRFLDAVSWEETAFYDRIISEIESGKTKWSCTSEPEFREVCRRFDDLHDSIVKHGFLSMRELHERGLDAQRPTHAHEVCVAIGRDGTLYSDEGRHRLFIAKILDIDKIPVRVLIRHTAWQELRNKVVAHKTAPVDFEGHPDLSNINNT